MFRGFILGYLEYHLGTFRAAYPVALSLFERVAPVQVVESVEQSLSVGTGSQTPLPHLLLFHGIAATLRYAVDHFVVGQYGAQCGTPVDHCVGEVGNAVVHQHLLFLLFREGGPLRRSEVQFLGAQSMAVLGAHEFKVLNELDGWLCLVGGSAEVTSEHALEGPLRPLIVSRVACAHLAAPVE